MNITLEEFLALPGLHPAARMAASRGDTRHPLLHRELARLNVTLPSPPPPPPPPKSADQKLADAREAMTALDDLTGPVIAADIIDVLTDVRAALGD